MIETQPCEVDKLEEQEIDDQLTTANEINECADDYILVCPFSVDFLLGPDLWKIT